MRYTADWWAFWAGVWAVGLTAAAAITGVVAWTASTIASGKKDDRIRGLELAISQQQERAAKAEKTLLDVQEAMKDRRFDEEQYAKLVGELTYGGHCPLELLVSVSDGGEPQRFADLVAKVLNEGKWPIHRLLKAEVMFPPGITLVRPAEANAEACVDNLARAFSLVGMKPDVRIQPVATVQVFIGPKP